MKQHKLGLVLSGGGARGFAHIGVLKALNENGIYPDAISAVSAGSIVGCLYADGHQPDEIFNIFSKLDIYKILKFYRPAFGMLRADGLQKVLGQALKAKNFEELKMPLFVCATNFTKARVTYFHQGSLINAVMASCAIPMVLKPLQLDGEFYVDGGLMNNLPIEPLEHSCEDIIGINVNPVTEATAISSFRNYADRVMHLALRANIQNNIHKCDIYIEPPGLMDYNLFKVSAAEKIYEIGYEHTIGLIGQIKADLS
ncbi:MAG: patatin-like phospholipase family protein [Bacteroidota bacterium]